MSEVDRALPVLRERELKLEFRNRYCTAVEMDVKLTSMSS